MQTQNHNLLMMCFVILTRFSSHSPLVRGHKFNLGDIVYYGKRRKVLASPIRLRIQTRSVYVFSEGHRVGA